MTERSELAGKAKKAPAVRSISKPTLAVGSVFRSRGPRKNAVS